MKNELITIGPITIYGYGLMIAIGVTAAYFVTEYRAKRKNLDFEHIFNLMIWCLIGGIIGAKLFYYITKWKAVLADPKTVLLNLTDGFVVYGGIIGGILAGLLYCKKKKLPFLKYFDLAIPSVALAQGFGRIGCFLAGCCYGIQTTSSCKVIFYNSDNAPNGIPLVPTQLISSGLNFIHFFVLIFIAKKSKTDGQVAAFYLIFYSIGRFILEFFRGDLIRGYIGFLSTSQFISIFIFLFGCGMLFFTFYYKRQKA